MGERRSFERRSERRSFFRERKKSATQFQKRAQGESCLKKLVSVSAKRPFFSALFHFSLPVNLFKNSQFSVNFIV